MKDPKASLQWIVDILRRHHTPFQITGGLAGIAFGSGRTLNDIDIDIPEDRMEDIVPDVRDFIEFGPERYKDDTWDLQLLTLDHHGTSIDLGGAETTRVFNKERQQWEFIPCDLTQAISLEVMGIVAPVVDPADYISYKQSLGRVIQGVAIDERDAEAAETFLQRQK